MTCPIRWGLPAVLAILALAAPAPAAEPPAAAPASPDAAAADKAAKSAEAAKAVESLYGADLKRVRATPAPADDVELAKQLLAAAGQQAAQPEFAALLYEKAADLAMAAPEGYALAVQAIEQLAAAQPERVAEYAERLVVIRQRQFDASKAAERPIAGEAFIRAILIRVDARGKSDADAAPLLRRAQAVARQIDSPWTEEIDGRLAAIGRAIKTVREIEDVKTLLARNPADAKLREKLVRLHLVDLDDPAAAAGLLDGVTDGSLRKYVPAAAKPLDQAPELACLELGEWYRTLVETVPAASKPAMAARAKAYYERFLSLHTAADLDNTKATTAVQKLTAMGVLVSAAPVKLTPAAGSSTRAAPAKPAAWVDLLARVDPKKDAVQGTWMSSGGIGARSPASHARLMIPVTLTGEYDLEVRCVRPEGNDAFGVLLPVGSSSAYVQFAGPKGPCHINGIKETSRKSPITNDQEFAAAISVKGAGDNFTIDVTVDEKPLLHWQGNPASLPQDWQAVPNPSCPGLLSAGLRGMFHVMRVRMLSGEVKPLRAGAVAAMSPAR